MTSGQVLPSDTSDTNATTGVDRAVVCLIRYYRDIWRRYITYALYRDRCRIARRWICCVIDRDGLGDVDRVTTGIRYRVGPGDDFRTGVTVRYIRYKRYYRS